MSVQVLLFGKPRELAGASEESIVLGEGASLADLVRVLCARHGPLLAQELAFPEKFMIMVNGQHCGSLDGMETRLKSGDSVAILPAVIGG
jgi:molybdopterin converting factor small subunit